MTKNKEITIDYWNKNIQISVQENTLVPIIPPPPLIKEPEVAVKKALENPIGAPPSFVR
jgi:hypothetical protein